VILSVVRDIVEYRSRRAPGRGVADWREGLEGPGVSDCVGQRWKDDVHAESDLEFGDGAQSLNRGIHVARIAETVG